MPICFKVYLGALFKKLPLWLGFNTGVKLEKKFTCTCVCVPTFLPELPKFYMHHTKHQNFWRTCNLAIWRHVCLVSCGLVFQCPNISCKSWGEQTQISLNWHGSKLKVTNLLILNMSYYQNMILEILNLLGAVHSVHSKTTCYMHRSSLACMCAWANMNPVLTILCVYTQQDYYGRQCGTLLHSYCTGTYTEVTVLLLWGNSAVTMGDPHSYSVRVPAWVLQGSIGTTSKKQRCYFSVGTSAVTV